jgi:curved DNA-binding protein CbpA
MAGGASTDMYDVLGIPHDADPLSVRRRYREQLRTLRLTPSADGESRTRLNELTHAYEVLGNPSSRALYDRYALRGPGATTLRTVTGAESVDRTPARIGEELLLAWILGLEPLEAETTVAPKHDRLVRLIATAGFILAVVFLVVVLIHG